MIRKNKKGQIMSDKLLSTLIKIAVFIIILSLFAPVFANYILNNNIRCKMSIASVVYSKGVLKNIACQTKTIDYSKKKSIDNDQLNKEVAGEMQSCWSQFTAGSKTNILPYNFWTQIATGNGIHLKPETRCFMCAQIILPDNANPETNLASYLKENTHFTGESIYNYLYPDSIRKDRFGKYIPDRGMSKSIFVMYVENKKDGTASNGVIAFGQNQETSGLDSGTQKMNPQYYCGVSLG